MLVRKRKEVQEVLRTERGGLGRTLLLHLFYNAVYLLALAVASPYIAFKLFTQPRFRAGADQRLGRLPRRSGSERCLWVHGVSVGELLAVSRFLELYRERHPDWDIVVSTTTLAGYNVAKRQYSHLKVVYYPIDLSWVVNRALRRIRPSLILLIELEIWPNFLVAARRRGVPVALINGRISDRSFRGYRPWQRLLAEPMRQISLFCVQNKKYAARLRALRIPAEQVIVTGTMKYDTIVTEGVEALRTRMAASLRIPEHSTVMIGGSTHPPEERILLEVYRSLVVDHPDLFLILAPRPPERMDEVEEQIRDAGLVCIRRSRQSADPPAGGARQAREHASSGAIHPKKGTVLLIDTMGELSKVYAAADVVFVGGSLLPHGGQNMMEAAGLGRAVLFGHYIRNFQDSVDLLLEHDAAVMVRDQDDLEEALRGLLDDPSRMLDMGQCARTLIREAQGASRSSLETLENRFEDLFPRRSEPVARQPQEESR